VPDVQELSPEFNDLIHSLLQKDPLQRPNWNELKQHHVWSCEPKFEFKKRYEIYPDQPQFAEFAKQKGIHDLDSFYRQRSYEATTAVPAVDIVRLSLNVQRHLASAAEDENVDDDAKKESKAVAEMADVRLHSKNVVLNFGDSSKPIATFNKK
jgi:serine/threonine protein kinase